MPLFRPWIGKGKVLRTCLEVEEDVKVYLERWQAPVEQYAAGKMVDHGCGGIVLVDVSSEVGYRHEGFIEHKLRHCFKTLPELNHPNFYALQIVLLDINLQEAIRKNAKPVCVFMHGLDYIPTVSNALLGDDDRVASRFCLAPLPFRILGMGKIAQMPAGLSMTTRTTTMTSTVTTMATEASSSTPPQTEAVCSNCQAEGTDEQKLSACARCQGARYCSKECQRSHWRMHKPSCFSKAEASARKDVYKETRVKNCVFCQKSELSTGTKLRECSVCESVRYCSKECQKQDWSRHKKHCGGGGRPPEATLHSKQAKGVATALQRECQDLVVEAMRCKEAGDARGEARVHGSLGKLYRQMGRPEQALQSHNRALEIGLKLKPGIDRRRGLVVAYLNLGNTQATLGNVDEAFECHHKASHGLHPGDSGDRGLLFQVYTSLGDIYFKLGRYQEALEHRRTALDRLLQHSSDARNAQFLATAHANLGNSYGSMGQADKAVEQLDQSLLLAIELNNVEFQAMVRGSLSTAHMVLQQHGKAKEHLEQALDMYVKLGDRDGVGFAYGNMGQLCQSCGQGIKALDYFKKSLNIAVEQGNLARQATGHGNIGAVLSNMGRIAEGLPSFEQALKLAQEAQNSALVRAACENLASVHKDLGNPDLALAYRAKMQ